MRKFYIIIARKIFLPEFWGHVPPASPSLMPMIQPYASTSIVFKELVTIDTMAGAESAD